MMNGTQIGRTTLFTQNLSMWRDKVRANSLSYCRSRTAKRNITSSELEILQVCVCFVGGQGVEKMLENVQHFSL